MTREESSPNRPSNELVGKIVDITTTVFPDINPEDPVYGVKLNPEATNYNATDWVEISPNLHDFISRPDATIATLEIDGALVGYSIAVPIDTMNPRRRDEASETAYIYFTAIEPRYQHRGLVGPLLKDLEDKLRQKGFGFVERDTVKDGDYANKVARAYGQAIVSSQTHHKYPEVGEQRFLRIDLAKLPDD